VKRIITLILFLVIPFFWLYDLYEAWKTKKNKKFVKFDNTFDRKIEDER
jgi:hypothetical protein